MVKNQMAIRTTMVKNQMAIKPLEEDEPDWVGQELGMKFSDDLHKLIMRSMEIMKLADIDSRDRFSIVMSVLASHMVNFTESADLGPDIPLRYLKTVIESHG